MSEIQRDRDPSKIESQAEINEQNTLGNLNKILEEVKKGDVPEKKMELIVDYVLKLCQIESKYLEQRDSLKRDIRNFIKFSIKDGLAPNLSKYNASKFDVDGHDGLDDEEQSNYSKALGEAIQKIIILGGIGNFSDTYGESISKDGFSNVDKYLASKLDLARLVVGEKGEKGFTSQMIQRYGNITEKEFKEMQESKFNTLSSESWGNLGVLLVKEFGDGVENVLRFLANIPAATILIPRYLKYRADINSSDEVTKAQGEIKMQELVKENPSLAILDMLGEKGVEMIKHLAEMLTSGKTGDIATALVMLAGLVAGGAGVAKIGLKLARKQAVMSAREAGVGARLAGETTSIAFRQGIRSGEKGASRVGEIANNVDDIVGGAGIGHILGVMGPKLAYAGVTNDTKISREALKAGNTDIVGRNIGESGSKTSKPEKLSGISYSFEKGTLKVHDFQVISLSKEQAYEKILLLIKEVSEREGGVKTIDFSGNMTPELHKVLNEIISGNYPALSIERLVSGQRIVDLAFSGGKHINDNLSKEICDFLVQRFKDKVNTILESSDLSGHERTVRSDYKHETTSLNKEEDFLNVLFGGAKNRKDFIRQVLSNISDKKILQIFSTIPDDRLFKLGLSKTSSIEQIKKVIFSDIENNFDFGIGTSVLGENATFEDKMLAFYKAETSAKRGVETGNIEAREFSFERTKGFAKKCLEAKETILREFKNGFIEVNGENCKIIVTDLRTGKQGINDIILRYVRKDGVLPNGKIQQLVKTYISQLNEGFDFISPEVKGVEVDIGEINKEVRDGKVNIEYFTNNNKGTYTRKALESKMEGKPGTRGFLDVVDMGLENLKDFDEIAQKLLSGEITESEMIRLLDAGGSVTAKFQELVKGLKAKGIELSLGGDEVFMYSGKLSPDEMAKIVSENVDRVGLRGRFTSSTNLNNAREVFETLDKQTGLIKPIEQFIEGVILRTKPGTRIPSNTCIRNSTGKEIPINLRDMVSEQNVLTLYEKGEVIIGNGITLIKQNNQIIININ